MWLSIALCEWGEPETSSSTGSSQSAWHSSHGDLNGEVCGKVSCPWELPLMLSTPAVLKYRDPLSPCVSHNKRQEGGFSRTFTLCSLSFRHHHLLFCVWLQWLQRGLSGQALWAMPFRRRGQIKRILEERLCSGKGAISSRGCVTVQVSADE